MIEELIGRAKSIDIDKIFDKVMETKLEMILGFVRSQLLSGERSDGTPIGTYSKSELGQFHVEMKFDKGLFTGGSFPNYDLFLEGDYHKSLVATVTSGGIEINSTDPKEPEIETNTGSLDNALTLNEEHLGILIKELTPLVQKEIHGILGT